MGAMQTAPLGAVGPGAIVATFYGFHPDFVARAIPDVWSIVSPEDAVEAREHGAGRALTRLFDVQDAAIARALYAADVDPCEALVLRLAVSGVDRESIAPYRGWDDDDWSAAADRLAERGCSTTTARSPRPESTPTPRSKPTPIAWRKDQLGPWARTDSWSCSESCARSRPRSRRRGRFRSRTRSACHLRAPADRSSRPSTVACPRCDHSAMATTPRAHDDLEAILSQVAVDDGAVTHAIASNFDATFTWNYAKGERPALDKLYEKAKTSQWNGTTDLDWSTDVDPERTAVELSRNDRRMQYVRSLVDEPGSPVRSWGEREITRYAMENTAHRVSQFLHGEQGALICTARIVETVPWIDAKYYASTQVLDEARHVEVFGRYLDEKLETRYPMNAHLGALIDDVLSDSRWDITYLGMQILIEGLALAAFGTIYRTSSEPLLRQLIRYVMSDEARHVAFGVLSLQEAYAQLSGRRCANARSSCTRVRCGCATASCIRRSGNVSACRLGPSFPISFARTATRRSSSSACCSRRSCRTARSWVCSTRGRRGSASGSPRWACSSTRTSSTRVSSTPSSTP
jgi:hypothetical protein